MNKKDDLQDQRPVISEEFRTRAQKYADKIGAYVDSFRTYGVYFVRYGIKIVELVSWYDLSRDLGYPPEESELHL